MPHTIEKQSKGLGAIKGGKRSGAGRKKGVPNKRTAELQAKVEASGLTPLEYMLQVLRDAATEPRERLAAAVAAAPYVHAKLASVEFKGSLRLTKTDLSDEDLAAIASGRSA